MGHGSTPSLAYRLACAAVALGLAAACAWIASIEWFSRDDFAFLAHVRGDAFSWRDTFLPGESRFWHFYRPLGMETYFRLCDRAFGLEAGGFFAVSLVFHFASGWLVLGIARRLGLDPRAALAAALLAVSRPPALDQIFYGSVFHFVLSVFLTLLAVRCFLERLAGGGWRWQAGALAAVALALLSNGVNAVAPAVLGCAGLAVGRPTRTRAAALLRALAPHVALVALYLLLRLTAIPLVADRAIYVPSLGLETLTRLSGLLADVFGGVGASAVALALAAALLVVAVRGRAAGAVRGLGWRALWLLGWAGAALAPFALLPFPQQRYAMVASAPAALLCGAFFDAAWRAAGARHPRALEAAFATALLVSIPFAVLAERARDPRGAYPLGLLRAVESRRAGLAPRARLVVLYGAPLLAGADIAIPYRYLAYNGSVLQAVYPGTEQSLRFHDLSQRPLRGVIRPGAVYLQLSPQLEVDDAPAELLERELRRAVDLSRPAGSPRS